MGYKNAKKIISLIIAVFMLLSMFFCACPLGVSAAGTTPDLVTFNIKKSSDWSALKYIKGWSTLEAGNYKATVNLKVISGEMPTIMIGEEINATRASWQENYQSSYDQSSYLYTITFSLSSDWTGNLGWYIGNYGEVTNFAVANPTLYLLDSKSNPTGSNLVNTFATNYYADSRLKDKWVKANCASSLVSFSTIPSNYFAITYDSGEYANQGASKMVRFTMGESAYITYTNKTRLFEKDHEYELGFECNILSGNGLDVELKLNETTIALSGTGYISSSHSYIVSFTPSVSTSNLKLTIGTSDNITHLLIAKPYIKEKNYTTNLIHDIAENTMETFGDGNFDTSLKKWNRIGGKDTENIMSVMAMAYNNDVLNGKNLYMRTTFTEGVYNRYLEYSDYYDAGIIGAEKYKLVADYRRFSANDIEVYVKDDTYGNSLEDDGVLTVDSDAKKLYYSFTAKSSSDSISIKIGSINKSSGASLGKINLYKLDSNGNITGDSIVDECNAITLDTTSSNLRTDRTWATIGESENDDYVKFATCEDNYFSAITESEKAVYFPSGTDNYQVLMYKDSDFTIIGGIYKLVLDQRTITGVPTVELRTGTDIDDNDTYTVLSDNTEGYTRTIIYTFSNITKGIGLFIGNFGNGTNVAVVFKNVCFYRVDNNYNPISNNIFEPMTTDRMNIDNNSERATSQNGYWTTLNYGFNNIKVVNPADYFENYTPSVDPEYDEPTTETSAKVLYISFDKTGTAYTPYLSTNLKLSANTTYIFEYNWKAYAGAVPFASFKYLSSSDNDYHQITPSALNGNTVDGVQKNTFEYDKGAYYNTGNYGHYKVSVTIPSDLKNATTNVNVGFYVYLNDDAFNNARGGVYFGNVSVVKDKTSDNLVQNGDFAAASEGEITTNFPVSGWEKGVSNSRYETMRFVKQPQNFFNADGASPSKALVFNGGNWDYIEQYLYLKPNTTYRLTYKASYINGIGAVFIKNYNSSNKSNDATKLSTSFDKKTSKETCDFQTDSDLRTIHENACIRFTIPYNGLDVKYVLGNIKLYELSGGSTVGPNLINNGGFTAGTPKSIKNVASQMSSGGILSDVELTGWKLSGSFEKNSSIDFVTMTKDTFPEILIPANRLTNLVNVLLQRKAPSGSPFEDVNNDNIVNILDLIETKQDLISLAGNNGEVDGIEQKFKSIYVNGNNTTDFDSLINFEDGSNMLATNVTGKVYYISSSTGNDSNNGTSPNTPWKSLSKANSVTDSGSAVLFKCGDSWRRESPRDPALETKSGVTYGSYGVGAKPILIGSLYNFAKNGYDGEVSTSIWTSTGTANVWKAAIKPSGKSVVTQDSVGHVVFDGVMGTMRKTKAELSNEMDFFNQEYEGNDGGDGYVYVYSKGNPANKWSDIEIGQKSPVITLDSNVTINNLCVKFGGEHGMSGGGISNVAISNCEVNYIGGSFNSGVRFGNGIQFGQGGNNLRVKNCYVTNVFDAALTFQSWGTTTKNWNQVTFSNNLITDSFMGIEWFSQEDSLVENIYLTDNIIRNMGGWCYEQRIGTPGKIGKLWCAGLRCGQDAYYPNISNFNIKNNIFDRSNGPLIYWWFNADGTANSDRRNMPGLKISGNSFYQDDAECRDGRVMNYDNQTGVKGASTGALLEAVKIFDESPNKVKYILLRDKVIYR